MLPAQSSGRLNVEKTPHRVITDSVGLQHGSTVLSQDPTQPEQPGEKDITTQPAASARQRSRRSTFKFPATPAAAAVAISGVPSNADAAQTAAHLGTANDAEAEIAADGSQGSEDTSEAAAGLGAGAK